MSEIPYSNNSFFNPAAGFDVAAYSKLNSTTKSDTTTYVSTKNKNAEVSESLKDNRIYFSGAQCEITIGGYMLEDAIELEASYSADQIPVYGYASTHFNTVGTGRVIVTGSLMVNYRYNGYLLAHINKAKKEQAAKNTGNSNRTTQQTTLKNQDLVTLDNSAMKSFQDTFWSKDTKSRDMPIRPEFSKGPFDIIIKDYSIGTVDQEPEERRIIDCFLVRMATVRKSDSTPVVEVYQFIARSII